MSHQPTPEEIGKAFNAYTAYNFKAKQGRLATFDLFRWVRVIRSIDAPIPVSAKRSWTAERTRKFKATMARKRERRLNGKAAAHVS